MRDRQTGSEGVRESERQTDRQTGSEGVRERQRHRERETESETDRQTGRQTERQTREKENKWNKKGKLYYLISHHVMSKVFLPASTVVVSWFGLAVRKKTSVLFCFNAPFSSKTVICELCACRGWGIFC